jgi:hypothetical protein
VLRWVHIPVLAAVNGVVRSGIIGASRQQAGVGVVVVAGRDGGVLPVSGNEARPLSLAPPVSAPSIPHTQPQGACPPASLRERVAGAIHRAGDVHAVPLRLSRLQPGIARGEAGGLLLLLHMPLHLHGWALVLLG